jgi:hypothetical protein
MKRIYAYTSDSLELYGKGTALVECVAICEYMIL